MCEDGSVPYANGLLINWLLDLLNSPAPRPKSGRPKSGISNIVKKALWLHSPRTQMDSC